MFCFLGVIASVFLECGRYPSKVYLSLDLIVVILDGAESSRSDKNCVANQPMKLVKRFVSWLTFLPV